MTRVLCVFSMAAYIGLLSMANPTDPLDSRFNLSSVNSFMVVAGTAELSKFNRFVVLVYCEFGISNSIASANGNKSTK